MQLTAVLADLRTRADEAFLAFYTRSDEIVLSDPFVRGLEAGKLSLFDLFLESRRLWFPADVQVIGFAPDAAAATVIV